MTDRFNKDEKSLQIFEVDLSIKGKVEIGWNKDEPEEVEPHTVVTYGPVVSTFGVTLTTEKVEVLIRNWG